MSPTSSVAAAPDAAPQIPDAEIVAVLRERRRHYEEVYFQQESRAQFLATIQLAAAGALVSMWADHGGEMTGASLVLAVLSAALLLFAFIFTASMFVPLIGRRLTRLDLVEGLVTWIGFFGRRREYASLGRLDTQTLRSFVEGVVLRRPGALAGRTLPDPSSLFESECYNVWAQWYVAERKAGVLRFAMVFTVIALPITGFAYFRVHDAVAHEAGTHEAGAHEAPATR
jgi:hypothetical protein